MDKLTRILMLLVLLLAKTASAQNFTYNPPGQLKANSGNGTSDYTEYSPDMTFPIEMPPAFANSQVYGHGGQYGPGGGQCDPENRQYPWQDNFCEARSHNADHWSSMCPDSYGHLGQDIRATGCEDDMYWVVAVEDGDIITAAPYFLTLKGKTTGIYYDYLHMSNMQVNKPQNGVKKGQKLGTVSSVWRDKDGRITKALTTRHLHFQIRTRISKSVVAVSPYMSLVRAYERLIGQKGMEIGAPPPNCTAPASPPDIPGNGATNIGVKTSFSWKTTLCGDTPANVYRIQVHTSSNFPPECNTDQVTCSALITMNEGTADARYPALINPFAYNTKYHWRVRGGHTLGAGGDWSNTWNFTTATDPNGNPPQCTPEICDGKDNNCDKQIDENLMQSCMGDCGQGMQICNAGAWSNCTNNFNSCGTCSNTKACNNACGAGTATCQNGVWVNCTAPAPKAESCNNVDDDCNGKIDDGVTMGCSIAPCNNPGTKTCIAGQWGICNGNPCGGICTPVPEICDNKDNNCDGNTDENLTRSCNGNCEQGMQICNAGAWSNCTNGFNSCAACSNTKACQNACGNQGIETCVNGAWINCTAAACPQPMVEICNNKDDDLDGIIDEGLTKSCVDNCGNGTQTCTAGAWSACNGPKFNSCGTCSSARSCMSICNTGNETCVNGAWVNCTARLPVAETCNNIDDDCDGVIDDNLSQNCVGACGNGTQTCNAGLWGACSAAGLNSCGSCSNTRACQNACGNQGSETCQNGQWINCTAAPCPIPLTAPILISPANDFIKQVSEGNAGSQNISWNAVNGAARYNYLVRVYSTAPIGSIYEQGSTAGTSHVVGFDPNKQYGMGMEWLVQAVDANNNTGPWSTPRHFYFSHPTNSLIYCNDGNCEKPGTVYKVMAQFRSPDIQGAPWRIVLEWVSAGCLNGRAKTLVAGTHLSSLTYYKSAAAGGCP